MRDRSTIIKIFVKGILFCILLTFFMAFYFVHQTGEFLKGSTTFTSRHVRVKHFESPVLILCFNPAYKPSKTGNHTMNLAYLFDDSSFELPIGTTFDQFIEDMSYILNKDFEIELGHEKSGLSNKKLNLGLNFYNGFQIKISKIKTMTYGLCHMLESDWKINITEGFQLNVTYEKLSNIDKPKELIAFVAARESWYGIISETWPYVRPNKKTLQFNSSNTFWFDMYVTKVTYRDGLDDISECITQWTKTINCNPICKPFFLSFLNLEPPCQSMNNTRCIYTKGFANSNQDYFNYKKCLKPKTTKNYNSDLIYVTDQVHHVENTISMIFTFKSDEMDVQEETLMIGLPSFIGSIGGSLGLFLGFSCFTFCSNILDKLHQLLVKKTDQIQATSSSIPVFNAP